MKSLPSNHIGYKLALYHALQTEVVTLGQLKQTKLKKESP